MKRPEAVERICGWADSDDAFICEKYISSPEQRVRELEELRQRKVLARGTVDLEDVESFNDGDNVNLEVWSPDIRGCGDVCAVVLAADAEDEGES